MLQIDVVTLFPGMFEGVLRESIIRIAQEKGLVRIDCHNLRDHTTDRHRKVDAPPYGGGAGMVIQPEPVFRAVERLRATGRERSRLILLTPQGETLTQTRARELSAGPGFILLCGHYEGFDERVLEGLQPLELSIGDYVVSGGEVPALVVIDAVVRLVPGVLGDPASLDEESFRDGSIEYPHYTRPREFRGMRVPDVLLSGDHAAIRKWREEQSQARTRARTERTARTGANDSSIQPIPRDQEGRDGHAET